eukprot:1914333-Prymnesium_polylepis.1
MSPEIFARIEAGHVIRDPMIVAMTEQRAVAERFATPYLCEIRVPAGCWNCSHSLEHVTAYHGEFEHLAPAWSVYTCKGKQGKTIIWELNRDNFSFDDMKTPYLKCGVVKDDGGIHGIPGVASCFGGDAPVVLADGRMCPAAAVRVGQLLAGRDRPARVLAVWKTTGLSDLALSKVSLASGASLWITPTHPVCLAGTWSHPCEISSTMVCKINEVFSFVLDPPQSIQVDNVEVASVGMCVPGFPDPFWGTNLIVAHLKARQDWPEIVMDAESLC